MAEDIRTLMGGGGQVFAEAPAEPHEPARASHAMAPGQKHNLAIAAMVVATVICVFALSRGAQGPALADAKQALIEQQVETAVKALDTVDKDDAKRSVRGADVAKSFYYQAAERQVPIANLKGNPFIYKPPVAKPIEPARVAKPEPVAAEEPTAVQKLTLQSVLVGSQAPAAMISNNLLTRGQQINGWTLVEINNRSVVLERNGTTYTLTMAE